MVSLARLLTSIPTVFVLHTLQGNLTAQTPFAVYGLNFSPYVDGQSPGSQIGVAQIQARLAVVASSTKWVRTYSSLNGLEKTCQIAHQMALKCAAGASIYGNATDAQEIASVIAVAQAGYADIVIVGTEALFRNNVTAQMLINDINQVKSAAPGVPVTTADTYTQLLFNPTVVAAVDVVMFNIYPFFESIPLDKAMSWVNGWYQIMVQAAGTKQVFISETGWPSGGAASGDAVASPVNAGSYFTDFVSWAKANNAAYFYFEAFDESWKAVENSQGPYFGVWDKNGLLKPGMSRVFNGVTLPDNWSGNAIPGGPGTPGISFTYVPELTSAPSVLAGQTLHIRPADYKITCYLLVGSTWYVQPYIAQPVTPIFVDGSWSCGAPVHAQVSQVAALLIPNGYVPPSVVNGQANLAGLNPVAIVYHSYSAFQIAGQVLDALGNGLDGIAIGLTGSGSELAVTSRGGRYAFVDLVQGGSYTIVPSGAGASFSPGSQSVPNLSNLQTVNFAATAYPLTISGQTSDTSGNALGGVTVTLNGTFHASAVSDVFGDYSISGLPGGSYSLTPSASGFTFQPSQVLFTNISINQKAAFAAIPNSALRFVPITPCRIADTRNAAGSFGGPAIPGGGSRDFAIPGSSCGIPPAAQAYSLNVAVVPLAALGYLTLWPAGQAQPFVATLNSDGRVKSNAAIVPAGMGGAVSVFASNTTDLVMDINGYFVPAANVGALAFYPLTPCRVSDTRNANGPFGGPFLNGGASRTIPIQLSSCAVPPAAQAYSVNLAAVPRGPLGYVTAWPSGQAQPFTANLNAPTGTVTSNAAIVPAGTNGSFDVFASNNTDLVIDINGYFAPPGAGGLSLYNLPPCRVLDSRLPSGNSPFAGTLDVGVNASGCGTPVGSQAYVFNATAVPQGPLGYLTLWAQGLAQPLVASLNAVDGVVAGNMAIVPTANGFISAFASNPTYLVLDLFGYFAP